MLIHNNINKIFSRSTQYTKQHLRISLYKCTIHYENEGIRNKKVHILWKWNTKCYRIWNEVCHTQQQHTPIFQSKFSRLCKLQIRTNKEKQIFRLRKMLVTLYSFPSLITLSQSQNSADGAGNAPNAESCFKSWKCILPIVLRCINWKRSVLIIL